MEDGSASLLARTTVSSSWRLLAHGASRLNARLRHLLNRKWDPLGCRTAKLTGHPYYSESATLSLVARASVKLGVGSHALPLKPGDTFESLAIGYFCRPSHSDNGSTGCSAAAANSNSDERGGVPLTAEADCIKMSQIASQ
jgi:hypothetical protein